MKSKTSKRIFDYINKRTVSGESDSFTRYVLEKAMETLYKNFPGAENVISKELFIMSYNAKYSSVAEKMVVGDITPYEKLDSFYTLATKGDSSFTRDLFFRHLRRTGDKEAIKLMFRLKKNQS